MKLSKRGKVVIGIITVIVGLLAWKLINNNKQEYYEYHVERQDITQTLELSGEVDAKKQEDLHFLAGGLVTYLPYQEGDEVKRFHTIASLDQRQLQKTLKKYLNTYAKQLNTFDNTQDSYEDQINSNDISDELRRTLEGTQYDLESSVLDVELQDLSIQLSHLYAPFDGILIKSPITSSHVNVSALDTFTLVDPTTLFFNADLDESDLSLINLSLPVIIELDAYPDLIINSHITYISYSSKELSTGTTYEVDVSLPEDILTKLRLGLNGTATIVLSEKSDILVLPIEAVVEDIDRSYVYLKNNGKPEEVEVTTGISDNNYIEILSGLSVGDRVVIEK